MEKTFTFGLGNQEVQVQVPAQQVLHVIEGKAAPAITDVNAAVQEALRNPIDSPPLQEVVKAGDKVLFGKYAGQTVKVDGEELLVIREDEILAVIQ